MPSLTPAYYFTLQGRIPRSQYWLYFRVPIIVLHLLTKLVLWSASPTFALPVLLIELIIMITLDVVGGVRRFHDRDKPGWWMLLIFIPILGWLWLLVELGFLKGTEGPNQFGDDPIALTSTVDAI